MRNSLRIALFAGAFAALSTTIAWSFPDDRAKKEAPKERTAESAAAEQEAWMKAATPGDEHKRLSEMVGVWECKCTSYFVPGQADESKAESKYTAVLGGRFIRHEFKGTMMGMPFEGLGYVGFDNIKQKYTNSWTDTFSTGMMTSEGDYDGQSKSIVLRGSHIDPLGNKNKTREVTKITDKDNMTFEMYQTGADGEEKLMMKMVCTRKKS